MSNAEYTDPLMRIFKLHRATAQLIERSSKLIVTAYPGSEPKVALTIPANELSDQLLESNRNCGVLLEALGFNLKTGIRSEPAPQFKKGDTVIFQPSKARPGITTEISSVHPTRYALNGGTLARFDELEKIAVARKERCMLVKWCKLDAGHGGECSLTR